MSSSHKKTASSSSSTSGGGAATTPSSSSGSHKKTSSSNSSSGAKTSNAKSSASHPDALSAPRKLSTKPLGTSAAAATSVSQQPPLEFSLTAPAVQTPQPLWLSWTPARALKECGGMGVAAPGEKGASSAAAGVGSKGAPAAFVDPEGAPALPASLAAVCVGWKRMHETAGYGAGVAERGLITISPLDGVNTVQRAVVPACAAAAAGWSGIVAAMLNLILAKRKLFAPTGSSDATSAAAAPPSNFLWTHTQPQSKDGVVRWSPSGKYALRVFHQADWKMLVVDDLVPVDSTGACLLPRSSNPLELWPTLLSKALLKLWPGVDFASAGGNGGAEILYSLAGWIVQSKVESKSLMEFPYPRANRPESPLLPFNPLTDSASAAAAGASPTAAASQQTARSATTPARGPTPVGAAGSPVSSSSNKKKAPGTARNKDAEDAAADGEASSASLATTASQATPLTTDQMHAYASRRGELGWFNELVYAAPGSGSIPAVSLSGAAAAALAVEPPAAPVLQQPPSGLLFGYTWKLLPAGADASMEGYPTLAQLLAAGGTGTEDARVPVLGQLPPLGAEPFDAVAAAMIAAGTTPAAASMSGAATPATPGGGLHNRGRSGSVSNNNASAPLSSKPSSSSGTKPGNKERTQSTVPVNVATPAAASASPIADAPDAAALAAAAAAAAESVPRFLCLLVEAFDEPAARLAFEQLARSDEAALAGLSSPTAAGGKRGSAAGAASVSGAKKPVTGSGSGASPLTPSTPLGKSPAAAGSKDGAAVTGSPSAGGAKAGAGPKLSKKEEDERQRREEEAAAAAVTSAARAAKAKADEAARAARAQSRMDAWLRGEEALLEEAERAKTVPQLLLTDLLGSGLARVARVDSFAARFPLLWLARDPSRYDVSGGAHNRVIDWWGGRELRKPFSAGAPAPVFFVPDAPPAGAPLLPAIGASDPSAPSASALALNAADASGSIPSAALRALEAHAAQESKAASQIAAAARARRLYFHLEFQATGWVSTGGASDAEPMPIIPSTASTMRSAAGGAAGLDSSLPPSSSPSPTPGHTKASQSMAAPKSSAGGSPLLKARPASGKDAAALAKENKKRAASPAPPMISDPSNLGPLQLPAPPSVAQALQYSVSIERWDWSSNRREIVYSKTFAARSVDEGVNRVDLIELILPPLADSPDVPAPVQQPVPVTSRPASGKKLSAAGGGGGSKKGQSAPSDNPQLIAAPQAGALYRVLVQSNAGYSLTAFSHGAFEIEEGKWAATATALAAMAGESSGKDKSEKDSGSSGSSKKDAPVAQASSALVAPPATSGGQALMERAISNTFVKGVEGVYSAVQAQPPLPASQLAAGAAPSPSLLVLFKYVVELHTPPAPPAPVGEGFSIAEEVAGPQAPPSTSNANTSRARGSSQSAQATPSSKGSGSSGSAADKKKQAAAAAAAAAAEAEAASIAAAAQAAAEEAARLAANPNAPAIYSKASLPQTAAQANQSLSMSWLHPEKRSAGGGTVCAPVSFKPRPPSAGPSAAASAATVPSLKMSRGISINTAAGSDEAGTVTMLPRRHRSTASVQFELPESPVSREAALAGPIAPPATAAAPALPSLWSPLVSTNHFQSTLLCAALSLQDAALWPYLRLEWINNDTLDCWRVPISGGENQLTPTMQFKPNTHGYTLLCTALLPPGVSLFSGRFSLRLLSSRPLLSLTLESLSHATAFGEEYRANSTRTLARMIVTGTTSAVVGGSDAKSGGGGHGRSESIASISGAQAAAALAAGLSGSSNLVPQSLLHFSTNLPHCGLIARVYDLDASLELPLASPPPPLALALGVQALTLPVFLASKESRVVVDVSFAPLNPTPEALAAFTASMIAHAPAPPSEPQGKAGAKAAAEEKGDKGGSVLLPSTGVHWVARFVSSAPLVVAADKSAEDELLALKASWAGGDAQRAKKARAAREAFLELRAAQQARANAQRSSQRGSLNAPLPAIVTSPPASSKEKPESSASAAAAAKKQASADLLVLPPIPPAPLVVQSSHSSSPTPIVLTDAMRADRALALSAEVDAARVFRLALDRQKDCLAEAMHKSCASREALATSWRLALDQRTHESWVARSELRRVMISAEAELAALQAVVSQAPEACTAGMQISANYDECNASHTPFNQLPCGPLTTAVPLTGKESKTAAASGSGSSSGATGSAGASRSSGSNKKGSHASAAELSALESGRFGLSAYLDSVEAALAGPVALPLWKGGPGVAAAVQRMQASIREALQAPVVAAALTHLQREQAPLSSTPLPGTPGAGGRKEKAAAAAAAGGSSKSTAESKAAAAAAMAASANTLADGTQLLPALDRSSLANSLWHAVLAARSTLPKLTRTQELDAATLQAELVLLALSVEQLEKSTEPLRYTNVAGSSAASSPSAARSSRKLASSSGAEVAEEKTNDEPTLVRAHTPSSPQIGSAQRTASAAKGSKGAKAAALAAAAAAAASLPPQVDYTAIEAWSAQVKQYAHLLSLSVDLPEVDDEFAPAPAPILSSHLAAAAATSRAGSRPGSASVSGAGAAMASPASPTSSGAAPAELAPLTSVLDAQWFGPGSEQHARQSAAAAAAAATAADASEAEEKSSATAFPSSPLALSAAPRPVLSLPPAVPLLDSASPALIVSAAANAAAALGRDSVVSLLSQAGAPVDAVGPRCGVAPAASASVAAAHLAVDGAHFLVALQNRARALIAAAQAALEGRRAEMERNAESARVAAAQAAAAAGVAEPTAPLTGKSSAHRKVGSISAAGGSNSNKKKAAAADKSNSAAAASGKAKK